ncbi:hypothetical protein UF75_5081 [Desulfosporosinus sp. I2]|nr:hypothetical protein UF75_5081 [Desulfosporosinus sp. I2]
MQTLKGIILNVFEKAKIYLVRIIKLTDIGIEWMWGRQRV